MPTIKKRINITVSDELIAMLEALSKRDNMPVATKAKQLLEEVIEIYEDEIWAKMATSRDTNDAKYISHEKAWL